MEMLATKDGEIVDGQGKPFRLRGFCIGGWLNLENFIIGYPGAEHTLRTTLREILGKSRANFFVECLSTYFFTEDDVAFIKSCGATAIRVPLNYRQFESDAAPFHYLQEGFAKLDQLLTWCARHNLYVILDMHAVQGWQNTDWHCDNSTRHSLFWAFPHFQERFVALWQEFARRYRDNTVVAGYNVMNEPFSSQINGRYTNARAVDWSALNRVYRWVVQAIREIDSRHLIFLDGDYFSQRFDGLDAPFSDNLVYSSHNYTSPAVGTVSYADHPEDGYWSRETLEEELLRQEGVQFAQKHRVPLWAGEFGALFNVHYPADAMPQADRVRVLDDQIALFEKHHIHWTLWTYKDIGAMGMVRVDSDSEYMHLIRPVIEAKRLLNTEFWWESGATETTRIVAGLANHVETVLDDPHLDSAANFTYLKQASLDGYVSHLMQPAYVRLFKDLSQATIERILQAFLLKNCTVNHALVEAVGRHCQPLAIPST
jgi:endoglucanase